MVTLAWGRWPSNAPLISLGDAMTVREFFTELIAQIENMNMIDFVLLLVLLAVVIVGGWRWIRDRDLRKKRWRDAMIEWRRASAKERRDVITQVGAHALINIVLLAALFFGGRALFNSCGGSWSSCYQKARDVVCVMATKNENSHMQEDGTCR